MYLETNRTKQDDGSECSIYLTMNIVRRLCSNDISKANGGGKNVPRTTDHRIFKGMAKACSRPVRTSLKKNLYEMLLLKMVNQIFPCPTIISLIFTKFEKCSRFHGNFNNLELIVSR